MTNEWKYTGIIYINDGTFLANGFERIVHGGRGDYVEIHPDQICGDAITLPEDQRWRVASKTAYYVECRTKGRNKVKIYHQRRTVDYADYKVGMYYVSPVELICFEIRGKRD